MVERSKDAAVKDVPIKLKREESASNTGQRKMRNDAAVKDAQTTLSKKECA
jgi:hypothetical protein